VEDGLRKGGGFDKRLRGTLLANNPSTEYSNGADLSARETSEQRKKERGEWMNRVPTKNKQKGLASEGFESDVERTVKN